MPLRTVNFIVMALLFFFLMPAPLRGEEAGSGGDVAISADTMSHDQARDRFHATGKVRITWERMILTADEATYDRASRRLIATGNIVMERDGDILKGERVTFDLESGRGELENSTMFIKQGNMHLSGKKIIRTGDSDYTLEQGTFTTCDAPSPFWKFSADDMDVTLGEFATGSHVVFYIKDVPAFYLPYALFPVKTERQSGFLLPRAGWSNRKGAELDLLYYWVISPSQEATLRLDGLTKRGAGTGVDYRYLRNKRSEGNFGGYLIYDLVEERWRGQMIQGHTETFSRDMNLRSIVNLTTDRNFYRDYGEKSGEYNRQTGDTAVQFLKTWNSYALTAGLRFSEDMYSTDNSATLQTLPETGFAAVRQQIFTTPLYFDLDSSLSNFYRETGVTGQRLLMSPRLTLATGIPGYLHLSAYTTGNLRLYSTATIPPGSDIKGSDSAFVPEAGAQIATSVSRIYSVEGERLKKIRHELVPSLSYIYSPERSETRIPFYTFSDRSVWQNILALSLTSHLEGKFVTGDTSSYRDISRIRLTQGFSIDGTRRDLLSMTDDGRPWTDLTLQSDTWLHPSLRFIFDAAVNVYDRRLASIMPGIEYDDRSGNSIGGSYRMVRDEVEYFEGRLGTKLFSPLALGYTTRYSFDRSGFLESVYTAEYRHQCWSINLSYRDRPGNQAFMVNFNLAGLMGK